MADSVEIEVIAVDAASNILQGIAAQFGTMGAVAASALLAVGSAMGSFISEAETKQDILARMNAILKATGGVSGQTSKSLQDLASSLSNATRFSDEQVLSVETLLLRFKALGGQYFPEATKAALDLAAATGQDAATAARQLGVALESPATGLSLLRRSGIVFTDEQKKQIEAMQKAGDTAGAQRALLDALSHTVGGVAEAMAQTTAGAWDQFHNKMLEVGDTIGQMFLPYLLQMADGLKNVADWLQNLFSGKIQPPQFLLDFFDRMRAFWLVYGPQITQIADQMWSDFKGFLDQIGPLLEGFVNQGLINLSNWFMQNGPMIVQMLAYVGDAFRLMWQIAVPLVHDLLNVLEWLAQEDLNVSSSVMNLYNNWVMFWTNAKTSVQSAIGPIKDAIGQISSAVSGVGSFLGSIGNKSNQSNFMYGGHRAGGGDVQPGESVVVGETGPELFTSRSGGYVTPNSALKGGVTVNLTYAPGVALGTEQALLDFIEQGVRKMQLEGKLGTT